MDSEKACGSLDVAREASCDASSDEPRMTEQKHVDHHIVLSVYSKAFDTGIHMTGWTRCCNFSTLFFVMNKYMYRPHNVYFEMILTNSPCFL